MNGRRSINVRKQRGLAMVEATIVLPLMFLLALGAAEFGRMLQFYNVLNKQQQDGARYLSARATFGTTGVVVLSGPAVDEARNLVVYGNTQGTGSPLLIGLSIANVTVTSPSPNHIRVAVEYNYPPIFSPVFSMFGYGGDRNINFPLHSSIIMRVVS